MELEKNNGGGRRTGWDGKNGKGEEKEWGEEGVKENDRSSGRIRKRGKKEKEEGKTRGGRTDRRWDSMAERRREQ